MRRGWYISGAGHLLLFLLVIFGGFFTTDRFADVTVAEVSIVSEAEYAALTPPEVAPKTQTDAPSALAPVEDEPPAAPAVDDAPEVSEPNPVNAPQTPDGSEIEIPQPVPETAVVDDAPEIDMPETEVDGTSLERNVVAAPAPRVAPTPSIAPPPQAEISPERVEDTAPDPELPPENVVNPDDPAALPEASDRIVTEAEETRDKAPASSRRPRSRPARPLRQAETPSETTENDETAEAIAAAVSEANEAATQGASSGPPLTGGETDAFRVAVGGCWVVDPGARSAGVKITVAFSLGRDGKVVANDIRQISATGGDAATQSAAFQAARRAVLRCQRGGYPLPVEKYEHWRDIEMTFNPEGMQVR
ncbi:MAG: energy transducer TonB [Boseongicola sp.]